jgi:hypothetical protein
MLLSQPGFVKQVTVILLILVGCSLSLGAQQAANLSSPKIISLNHELFVHPPQWSGGAFMGIESPESAVPIIVLFDREGNVFSRMYPRIPGAKLVAIRGQARGADGTVALVGGASDSEGRGSSFLAILSAQGDTEQIARLGNYHPMGVTITSDGSIWTYGHNGSRQAGAVLRRFDRSGKLINSFVPQSSFQGRTDLSVAGNAFVSSGERVGFLCGHAHRYIEISLDGKVTQVSFVTGSPMEQTTGLALTRDGRTFVSTEDAIAHKYNFYILDTKKGTLLPVPHSNKSFLYERLAGVDDDGLVAVSTDKSAIYTLQR